MYKGIGQQKRKKTMTPTKMPDVTPALPEWFAKGFTEILDDNSSDSDWSEYEEEEMVD